MSFTPAADDEFGDLLFGMYDTLSAGPEVRHPEQSGLGDQATVEELEEEFLDDAANFRDPYGNQLTTDEVMNNMDDYIAANTDVDYKPLFEEDAVHIRTEVDALMNAPGTNAEDALISAGDVAGYEVGGVDVFQSNVPSGKVPGKTNPKASWRTDDTSGKWYKGRQKFTIPEGMEDDAGFDAEAYEAKYGDPNPSYDGFEVQGDLAEMGNTTIHTTEAGVDLNRVDWITEEQYNDLMMEVITETAHESYDEMGDEWLQEPVFSTGDQPGFVGEPVNLSEIQLSDIKPGFFTRAAALFKRKINQWGNKLFGGNNRYFVDTDAIALEMQNMESNDLSRLSWMGSTTPTCSAPRTTLSPTPTLTSSGSTRERATSRPPRRSWGSTPRNPNCRRCPRKTPT